jgi:starch-binding outer membrane protein, SusD/RagB family
VIQCAAGKDFVPGKHELLLLPQPEIDLSSGNLAQNPGY